jgi:hypothetical protein
MPCPRFQLIHRNFNLLILFLCRKIAQTRMRVRVRADSDQGMAAELLQLLDREGAATLQSADGRTLATQ